MKINLIWIFGLTLCEIPQIKIVNGFSPNFQHIFITKESEGEKVLDSICKTLLPWQHTLRFRGLAHLQFYRLNPRLHEVHKIFRTCLQLKHIKFGRFLRSIHQKLLPWQHFWRLLCLVHLVFYSRSGCKSMSGCLQNVQDMFTWYHTMR